MTENYTRRITREIAGTCQQTSPRVSESSLTLRPESFTSAGDMADAECHVHSRGSLALGGRFAGRTVRFLRSRPVTDRGSVFVAHLAFPVSTEAEANAALSALKRACAGDVVDHAMSAWRVPKRGTGRGEEKRKPAARKKPMTETFFDDDGETRGGASIRAELNALDAVGVACVVTRAYGGINLGKKGSSTYASGSRSWSPRRESNQGRSRARTRSAARAAPTRWAAGAPRSGTVSRRRWAARQGGPAVVAPRKARRGAPTRVLSTFLAAAPRPPASRLSLFFRGNAERKGRRRFPEAWRMTFARAWRRRRSDGDGKTRNAKTRNARQTA